MSMFTRKHPRVVKPEKLEFQYTVYLVTSGEAGIDYDNYLEEPTTVSLSKAGGQDMINIGQNLGRKHDSANIAVWCASQYSRHKIAAMLLAEGLDAQLEYIPEDEIIEQSHKQDDDFHSWSHLAERFRLAAETDGTTVFVILASQPFVATFEPTAHGQEGACYGFTATSKYHRQPIILKPIQV